METAEEKRLRLAKAYIEQLRERGASSEEEEDEEEDDGDDDDDALGARLRNHAMVDAGYATRPIADQLALPALGECSTSEPAKVLRGGDDRSAVPTACKSQQAPRAFPPSGHHLSVTAVSLTEDDTTAFSVSKDGGMFRWDVETGKKTRIGTAQAPLTVPAEEVGAGEPPGCRFAFPPDRHSPCRRAPLPIGSRRAGARCRVGRCWPCPCPRMVACWLLAAATARSTSTTRAAGSRCSHSRGTRTSSPASPSGERPCHAACHVTLLILLLGCRSAGMAPTSCTAAALTAPSSCGRRTTAPTWTPFLATRQR